MYLCSCSVNHLKRLNYDNGKHTAFVKTDSRQRDDIQAISHYQPQDVTIVPTSGGLRLTFTSEPTPFETQYLQPFLDRFNGFSRIRRNDLAPRRVLRSDRNFCTSKTRFQLSIRR